MLNGYMKYQSVNNKEHFVFVKFHDHNHRIINLVSSGMEEAIPSRDFQECYAPYGRVFALIGFSGAGKDLLKDLLIQYEGIEQITSYTTRPKRENEVEGQAYHFIDNEMYNSLSKSQGFDIKRAYNTIDADGEPTVWHYGYSTLDLDLDSNNYISVVDYGGYKGLKDALGDRVIPIYIEVSEQTRRLRVMNRAKFNELEWIRRAKDDNMNILKQIEDNVPIQNWIKAEKMMPFELIDYIMKYFIKA